MADIETLGILEEIQALVSDKLQVVSYKWLSRNFSLSSNDAKRLLQEFVAKHGSELEVIYALSGWLKDNSQVYHISLVSGPKLAEVKCRFENGCSIQVYSVQACIPNDPAAIWNTEFAQAEELFDQPSSVKNCLRDNRFCGVSNSFVKHHATGESGVAPELPKIGVTASSKTNDALQVSLVPQAQERQPQKPSPKLGHQASTMASTDDKIGKNAPDVHAQAGKPNADKVTAVPAIKKKSQNEKSSSGAGGSLANLWGRATAKSKSSVPSAEAATVIPNPIVHAEAQICAQEALDTASSDDEGQLICKRESNGEGTRKRRVVFDDSDDEDDYENIVNLASPDVPKRQPILDFEPEVGNSDVEKNNLNVVKNEENLEIKKENASKSDSGLPLKEDSKAASKSKITKTTSPEKIQSHTSAGLDHTHKRDKASDAATTSPKRKKVLKRYIDERGREVTEVVWEGQTADNKNTEKKTIANVVENRLQAASRPPAFGSAVQSNKAGKVGSKKPAKSSGKDLKRGSILSFFKKE